MNSTIFSGGFTSILKKVGDDIPFSFLFCKGHTVILIILKKIREILRADFFIYFFILTNKYFFKHILFDSCDILRLKIV